VVTGSTPIWGFNVPLVGREKMIGMRTMVMMIVVMVVMMMILLYYSHSYRSHLHLSDF
jgi:hypothetical protein